MFLFAFRSVSTLLRQESQASLVEVTALFQRLFLITLPSSTVADLESYQLVIQKACPIFLLLDFWNTVHIPGKSVSTSPSSSAICKQKDLTSF